MQTQNHKDGDTAMGPTIVRIAHRSLSKHDYGQEGQQAYHWPFPEPPVPGQWVIAPTSERSADYAVVTGLGDAADAKGAPLNTIAKVVPEEAVAEALRTAKAETTAWLWLAQRTAGFPAPGYPAPPDEYPYSPIPPSRGAAPSADAANEYGLVWRRAYSQAQEYGLPDEQVKRFNSISEQWFAIARSWPLATAQRSTPSNAPATTDVEDVADAPAAPAKRGVPKWLLVLAAAVIALVVIVVVVRVVGARTHESNMTPPTSHPTTSQSSAAPAAPARANAQCRDGTYSFSNRRAGSCAGHGGVATWLDGNP